MPLETEFKYLLLNEERVEKTARKQAKSIRFIEQAYLPGGGRIRRITRYTKTGKPKGGALRHVFTYKHDLRDRSGVMEIETTIAAADFNRLWKDASFFITKIRYDIPSGGHIWEVDCFKLAGANYLIMAECEVEENPSENPLAACQKQSAA